MKSTDYPTMSPAAEKLREYIRSLYAPIDRSGFDSLSDIKSVDSPAMPDPNEILFTARSLAMELNVPLSQVLRVVHRGLVRPMAKTTAGGWLFSKSQLSSIKALIETK